ncbi:citrate synthase [Persicimonas caeni]|uniref:Citrate synthase n=2 Tax=Persicimonas caeni TaxID=2292766 RepID=A0A4Y6Q2Q0_PERCE|nr:citrate synthase [Persicimonas caeni]QED36034.1 citrate synthase [Persicimonas caeni]
MVARGLADVVAVATRLSKVDGRAGELIIGGYPVERLAGERGFEAVAGLLWGTDLSSQEVQEELGRLRVELFDRLEGSPAVRLSEPMDALRAGLAGLEASGELVEDALTVTAAVPVINALWWRQQTGEAPFAPSASRGHVADAIAMVVGEEVDPSVARAFEKYLVTVSDHGMNASTFTARVIASTRSDLVSAVVGAVGALKGPLHGGAPGPVLDMLDEIGSPERAEEWIRAELAAGRRIMGMGHRVYRVRDPRAAVFEGALSELSVTGETAARLEVARAVERTAERVLAERYPERNLKANVEFYTAVLLEAVGLPRELFTPAFAAGRILGWSAHVMEQAAEDRLIRPRSAYVGEIYG